MKTTATVSAPMDLYGFVVIVARMRHGRIEQTMHMSVDASDGRQAWRRAAQDLRRWECETLEIVGVVAPDGRLSSREEVWAESGRG